jgi:hypothetical protein
MKETNWNYSKTEPNSSLTSFPTKDTLVVLVVQNLHFIYYDTMVKKSATGLYNSVLLYILYLIQLSKAQFSTNGDTKVRNKMYYMH